MILCFPDLDTFRLVVTSTMLPTDVSLAPATAHLAADGRVFIDTPAKIGKKATGELSKLGVSGAKAMPGAGEEISCWLQVLAATKDAAPPQLASQAPVLFELPAATDLPAIVGEMLRLGNDRQSFRFLADDRNNRRVLLRVIGPPYYTLLRALDHLGSGDGPPVRAYTEAAPRVWVQIGHTHPAAAGIKPADEQLLLIRAPREWEYVADAPFQDVYDILQFKLPTTPTDWSPVEAAGKLDVKLKLVAGNAADAPELWVLKGDAVRQLDEFVRDSDERLTNRLKFAVADAPTGEKVVVLRVSPSKLAPPSLQFKTAVGFKPFFKLPNLFLPAGTRLHPQLRRDAVRSLLADDTDLVTWLYPGTDGQFVPETLSENAFRPLEDWVEYVIETAHAPLKEWIDASRFRFEAFVCADGQSPKPKPPADKPDGKGKGGRDDGPTASRGAKKKATGDADQAVVVSAQVAGGPPKPPNEWKLKRDELEKEFLAVDGPLDAPERAALWPQLAVANAGAGDAAEAAVCWANAAWSNGDPSVLAAWAAGEAPATVTAAEFDKRLAQNDPTRAEARQALAATLAVVARPTPPDWFKSRLPAVQRYFEANEGKLPVRSVWLLATAMARSAGADVLGLARVRDRLLQRLLDGGLNPELDIPFFLRSAGLNDSERVRQVHERLPDLHKAARAWVTGAPRNAGTAPDIKPTLPYVDLLFAFGYARLGCSADAHRLAADAEKALLAPHPDADEATCRALLYRGFAHRIEQALANKPHFGPLPADLLTDIAAFQEKYRKTPPTAGGGVGHYPVSRLRAESRVLEPVETHDTYLEFLKQDGLKLAIYEMEKITDPDKLRQRIRELYHKGVGGPHTADHRFLVLHDTILPAARLGEDFGLEMLAHVPPAMAAVSPTFPELPRKQGKLLERSLLVAAHFDARDTLRELVAQFVAAVRAKPDEGRFEVINFVAGQCLRSLRRFGLTEEIDRLLKALSKEILGDRTPAQLRGGYATDQKLLLWLKALRSMAGLAGGWLSFGSVASAVPLLDEIRTHVLAKSASAGAQLVEFTALVAEYMTAVCCGPTEMALERTAEIFRQIEPGRITNTQTTSKSYSRLHLKVIEAAVLALASDEFAVGAAGRRWLEDDEYLVRKRVHADMRKHLSGSGL